jgi:hypothetical protein
MNSKCTVTTERMRRNYYLCSHFVTCCVFGIMHYFDFAHHEVFAIKYENFLGRALYPKWFFPYFKHLKVCKVKVFNDIKCDIP